MNANRVLIVFLLALLAGCDGDRDDAPTTLARASLPGVYSGEFPCDGCPGVETELWLHDDGRFFLQQGYPEVDEQAALTTYNLGRWTWVSEDAELVLAGSGPQRRFIRSDANTLLMLTDTGLEHRLERRVSAPAFSAVIRMSGTMRFRDGAAVFEECLTGLAAPVEKRGDYRRFLHQYRSVGKRGAGNFVEFEGRFTWTDNRELESITIERFITVKVDGSC
jgi:uncharacterized lipoprotein NlpE involved in copper resistance